MAKKPPPKKKKPAAKPARRPRPPEGRRKPPNLRVAEQAEMRSCSSCEHYRDRYCHLWQWQVRPFHVCDTWAERSPAGKSSKDQALEDLFGGGTAVVVKVPSGGTGA